MELAIGVLETTVTVEQWVRVRIGPYCFLESVKYQWIVVAVTNHIGDNTAVIQIKNMLEASAVFT